jgi:hypothetical protein
VSRFHPRSAIVANEVADGGDMAKNSDDRTRLRSIEEALADLIAKRDEMPRQHPDRPRLKRMIGVLEAEIAFRAARDSKNHLRGCR